MKWLDIDPRDAEGIDCRLRPDLDPPLNESQEPCPWPWDPQQLKGAPLGQYHCPYCGAMVMAGWPHLDYRGLDLEFMRDAMEGAHLSSTPDPLIDWERLRQTHDMRRCEGS